MAIRTIATTAVVLALVAVPVTARAETASDPLLVVEGAVAVLADTEEPTALITTDEGTTVAVEGEEVEDLSTGDKVKATLEISDDVADDLDVSGTVLADTSAGEEVIDESGTMLVLSLKLAAAAVAPETLDSYGAMRPIDIVVNDSNPRGYLQPTDAQITEVIETASEYYEANTNGAIGGFYVRSLNHYTADLTCDDSDFAWADDAASHTGQGLAASEYIGTPESGTPEHLLVIGSCRYGFSAASATLGDGLGSGGWTVFVDQAFWDVSGLWAFDHTLIHELGHNLSLHHAGSIDDWDCEYLDEPMFTAIEKCGFQEYGDYMSPMGAMTINGAGDVNETAALDAYRRDALGVMPAGTVAEQSGASTATYTLGTLGVGTGTQAIKVTGPTSGQEYYIEYRTGAGEETAYQFQYPDSEIVRVTEVLGGGLSEWSPVRLNSVDSRIDLNLKAGAAWSNVAGDVHLKVNSNGSSSANVTVTTGAASRVSIQGVTLSGPPTAGTPVTAVVNGLTPAGATRTYQWFKGLELIEGATSASYTPVASDVGSSLRVQVVAKAASYFPTSATSSPVEGFVRTALPAILGTAKPDNMLTAVPGAGVPTDATLTYQWLRDGVDVPDATAQTYAVTTADGGYRLSVRVTATWDGGALEQTSPETIEVAIYTFRWLGGVTSSGSVVVGETVTVNLPEAFLNPAPSNVTVEWSCDSTYREDRVLGTGTSYTVSIEDTGCVLNAIVRATKTAYQPFEFYAVSEFVTGGPLNWRAPSIPTTVAVGTPVTADPGGWNHSLWLSYQWYRNGSPIWNAIDQTYTPTASDRGTKLTVKVRGADPDLGERTVTSNAVTVPLAALTGATPKFTGAAKVGSTVTAVPGTWTSGATLSYRWYANGVSIYGATGKSYKIPSSLIGKKISVKVTGKKSGYTTKTLSSTSIGVPRVGKPYLSGSPKVGRTLYARTGTWTTGTTFSYQWYVNGVAVKGATTSKLFLKSSWVGKLVKVKVSGKKTGYTSAYAYAYASSKVYR